MATLVGIQSASAIVDCIKFCHEGYQYVSTFIRALKEMGHDVAELEQRFKEEECRMWTFALAHNIVLGDDHPRDAVILSSLPPFWLEVVDGRFVQVKEHIEDAENLVRRYIDGNTPTRVNSLQDVATTSNLNFESSPGGPQNVLASLSISERDVKDTSTSSTFSLESGQPNHKAF
jgi:hypothetical protein